MHHNIFSKNTSTHALAYLCNILQNLAKTKVNQSCHVSMGLNVPIPVSWTLVYPPIGLPVDTRQGRLHGIQILKILKS